MAFDWTEYLILAEELVLRTDDEAALRSAVSRAYYAAYCRARNFWRHKHGRTPANFDVHKAVWDRFRENLDQRYRSIGTIGDRLRRWRNKADYDDEFPEVLTVANNTVTMARRLLGDLGKL